MKAHAIAVTEQPAAVIFVIIASPLQIFNTVRPSVTCAPLLCQLAYIYNFANDIFVQDTGSTSLGSWQYIVQHSAQECIAISLC